MLALLSAVREHARASLPNEVWNWLQAAADGAGDESDASAWRRRALRPRVLRDVADGELSTTLLGQAVQSPVLPAPIGYQTFLHPDGEAATARAIAPLGVPFIASTRSTTPFVDIAAACPEWWLQVYMLRDRGLTAELVRRAVANGATALVLTGDTPFLGGQAGAGLVLDTRSSHRINLDGVEVADGATEQDPTIGLDTITWLRETGGVPVLVKGVLRGDDAAACVACGAAGIVVSNHGRRQAARAISTARALPEVVASIGATADVLVDGGVRDGTTIVTALALGARAVLVGRPVMWGLAANGASGVADVLQALHDDALRQLGLLGARSIHDLTLDLVAKETGHG